MGAIARWQSQQLTGNKVNPWERVASSWLKGTAPGATTKEKQGYHGIDGLSSLRAFLCKGRIEKSRDSRCLTRLRLLVSKTKAKSRYTIVAEEFVVFDLSSGF